MLPELVREPVAERKPPHRPLRFRCVLLPPDERLTDAQKRAGGVGEADVVPTQAADLARLQTGGDDAQEDDARLLPPRPLFDERPLDAPDPDRRQDAPVPAGFPRPLDRRPRVRAHKPRSRRVTTGGPNPPRSVVSQKTLRSADQEGSFGLPVPLVDNCDSP